VRLQRVHIPHVAMWRHSGLFARSKPSQQFFGRLPPSGCIGAVSTDRDREDRGRKLPLVRGRAALAHSFSVRASSREVDSLSHLIVWFREGRRRSARGPRNSSPHPRLVSIDE
jgi:hypothetical protein